MGFDETKPVVYFMGKSDLAKLYDPTMKTEDIVAQYLHEHFMENPEWVERLKKDGPHWFSIFVGNRPETYYSSEGHGALVKLVYFEKGREGYHPSKIDGTILSYVEEQLLKNCKYVRKTGGKESTARIYVYLRNV